MLSDIFSQNILLLITMAIAPLQYSIAFGMQALLTLILLLLLFSSAIQAVPLCINDLSTNQRKKSVLYLT